MSYFDQATMIISEIGAYGDDHLEGEEHKHSDRSNRIKGATESLCDYVHEYTADWYGSHDDGKLKRPFKQDDLDVIAHMIAVGMHAQFKHDFDAECRYMAHVANEAAADPVQG
jgi:hypothetical protein